MLPGIIADCAVLSSLLQMKWEGVLHHVCGDHDWIMDRCAHEELTVPCSDRYGNALEYFSKGELAHVSLQNVVLNPRFLTSLKYYTNFRYMSICNVHTKVTTFYLLFSPSSDILVHWRCFTACC